MGKVKRYLILSAALTGCASAPIVTPTRVEVPVPVPCVREIPAAPIDPRNSAIVEPAARARALLAHEQRQAAHIQELRAILLACMDKPL